MRKLYCSINEQIIPSDDLIERTKRAMHFSNQKKFAMPKRYYLGGVFACFVFFLCAAIYLPGPEKVVPDGKGEFFLWAPSVWHSDYLTDGAKRDNMSFSVTEEEMYRNNVFGSYIPRRILGGFSFSSAHLHRDEEGKVSCTVFYENGYSYIHMRLALFQPEDRKRLVKKEEKEKYNISSYSIPFADSVPKEYYETMYYPIFIAKEFDQDILQARIYYVAEQGEDSLRKGRVNFAILCDNMIVDYTIKAAQINDILTMVQSANFFQNPS